MKSLNFVTIHPLYEGITKSHVQNHTLHTNIIKFHYSFKKRADVFYSIEKRDYKIKILKPLRTSDKNLKFFLIPKKNTYMFSHIVNSLSKRHMYGFISFNRSLRQKKK